LTQTFITPTIIAKLAIPTLLNNLVFGNLVHKDYSAEFRKKGDTVRIRKPATFTAIEFDGDLTGQFQEVVESYLDIKMDHILTVPWEVTTKQATLDVWGFHEQVVIPACEALAQKVDTLLAGLYVDIPHFENCETTSALSDIANVDKMANDLKWPNQNRYGVLSPLTKASFIVLDAFLHAEKRGDTQAIKDAALGRVFGIDWLMSQNIPTHAIGTTDVAGTAAIAAAGVSSMLFSALGTGTLAKGTLFTIAGDTTQYVLTAAATIADNTATVYFKPTLQVATTAGTEVVTINPAATTSKENLVFHKNAFAMVTAPIEPPLGGATAANESYGGLSLQAIYSYNHLTFKNVCTLSILCGVKTLNDALALRLCDAS